VNVQVPGTVAPAATVTEGHVAVRPVAGVIAVVKATVPAKPQVVPPVAVHVVPPEPPRLATDRVEVPLPPVVNETGELAESVKSLIRAVSVGVA
jgi:hypothetical protein